MTSGIFTIMAILGFTAAVWWAYGSSRQAEFERVAQLPLEEDEEVRS